MDISLLYPTHYSDYWNSNWEWLKSTTTKLYFFFELPSEQNSSYKRHNWICI
jgi:hypothetical protein